MKLTINKQFWIYFFSIILFFKPMAINSLPAFSAINGVWDILRVLNCFLIVGLYFRNRKMSKVCTYIIIIEAIILVSTLLNKGNVREIIVQGISIVTFCMLLDVGMQKHLYCLVSALFNALFVLIILQCIFMILYPNGMGHDAVYYNTIYFLASKNGLIKYFLPGIISGILMCEINQTKLSKRVWLTLAVCVFISGYVQAATAIVGLGVTLIIYFVYRMKRLDVKINFKLLLAVVLVLVLAGSIFAFTGGFVQVLGLIFDTTKVTNYTNRIRIWRQALAQIAEAPFIGYGMPKSGGHILMASGKYLNAHNGYLDILLYGGIAAFGTLIVLFRKMLHNISPERNSLCVCVGCGIIGFFVMMITESHAQTISFWGLMVMFERTKSLTQVTDVE